MHINIDLCWEGGVVALRRADDLCFDILCGCLFRVWAWCVRFVVVVYNL